MELLLIFFAAIAVLVIGTSIVYKAIRRKQAAGYVDTAPDHDEYKIAPASAIVSGATVSALPADAFAVGGTKAEKLTISPTASKSYYEYSRRDPMDYEERRRQDEVG